MGLSQQEFADKLDLNRGKIDSYEKESEPKLTKLIEIAEVLNIDLSKLLTEEMNNFNYDSFLVSSQKQSIRGKSKGDSGINEDALSLILRLKSNGLTERDRSIVVDEVLRKFAELNDEVSQLKSELVNAYRKITDIDI